MQRDMSVLLDKAVAAVTAACRVARAVQDAFVHADHALTKDDRSPVTVADFAVQALVCRHLEQHAPGIGMISEESAEELGKPEHAALRDTVHRYVTTVDPAVDVETLCRLLNHPQGDAADAAWVLDPIDGTKGFIRGDQYAIALGLVVGGEPVLAALGCPNYAVPGAARDGRVFFARRGGGAFARRLSGGVDMPLRVRDDARPADGICIRGVESAHASFDTIGRIKAAVGMHGEDVKMDGQGKYGAVAAGDVSVYLRIPRPGSTRRESIWDHAAGAAIVTEAGGRVSDMTGAPLDFSRGARLEGNTGIVASSGRHHDAMLDAVAQVWRTVEPGGEGAAGK